MNDSEVETYFLWLTEAEQFDLFDYEDINTSIVSNLICESVMDQNSVDFDPIFYENTSKDVDSINSYNIPNSVVDTSNIVHSMNYIQSNAPPIDFNNYPVTTAVQATGINVDNEVPPDHLNIVTSHTMSPDHLNIVNSHTMSHYPVETSVQATGINVDSDVPPDHLNIVTSHTMSPDHLNIVNSHTMSHYPVETSVQATGINVDNEVPPDQLNIAILDVFLEQLGNAPVPVQQELSTESIDFTSVPHEVPMVSQNNNVHLEHYSSDSGSMMANEFEKTTDSVECQDDSSRDMVIDENPQVSDAESELPVVQMCIRHGCVNPAIENPEWEHEFCSNDCVIMHCRDVFNAWVEGNAVMSQ